MTQDNLFAAPNAVVADPPELAADRLLKAHVAINRSRLGFVAFFACLFFGHFLGPAWNALIMVTGLLSAHVFLGVAASHAGRSWVLYALAPVLVPALGPLIAFGVLRSKIPYPDA